MAAPDALSARGGVTRSFRALAAAGVLAAAVVGVCANVLVSRFYARWDWTSSGLYTLSAATEETLAGLNEPVDVIVFLSSSDPLTLSVRHMLTAYGSKTQQLHPRFVDPDRNAAEFLALRQKYGLTVGKTEDGRIVTDASIVIARGEKRWFITTDDMVAVDENDGRSRPKLEQALTEGLRSVLTRENARICFSTGHGEASIDDGGQSGAAELRYRLEKNNFVVEAVDLSAPTLPKLEDCRVLLVGGPEQPVTDKIARHVQAYLEHGGNVALLINPGLDEDNRIRATGFESVARSGGIEPGQDFVVEKDEALREANGLGETFLATPKQHAVTRGLARDDKKIDFRVLVTASQSLSASAGGQPATLLVTSGKAFSVKDVRPFMDEGKAAEKGKDDRSGPFAVAMATELSKPSASKEKNGPRLLVVGTSNVLWGRNWRDPALAGDRLFMESALAWLAARPTIVSVPEKASHDIGLSLTEESLGDVRNYVLVYMPLAALAMGGFVLYLRRAAERRSRKDAAEKKGEPKKSTPERDEDDRA